MGRSPAPSVTMATLCPKNPPPPITVALLWHHGLGVVTPSRAPHWPPAPWHDARLAACPVAPAPDWLALEQATVPAWSQWAGGGGRGAGLAANGGPWQASQVVPDWLAPAGRRGRSQQLIGWHQQALAGCGRCGGQACPDWPDTVVRWLGCQWRASTSPSLAHEYGWGTWTPGSPGHRVRHVLGVEAGA